MNEKAQAALASHREKVKSGGSKDPHAKAFGKPNESANGNQCFGNVTPTEIRNCTATNCALYPVRPFK